MSVIFAKPFSSVNNSHDVPVDASLNSNVIPCNGLNSLSTFVIYIVLFILLLAKLLGESFLNISLLIIIKLLPVSIVTPSTGVFITYSPLVSLSNIISISSGNNTYGFCTLVLTTFITNSLSFKASNNICPDASVVFIVDKVDVFPDVVPF